VSEPLRAGSFVAQIGESEDVPVEVLRLGGVARLDPEPDRELAVWRADLQRGALDDPDETRRRLAALERGEAVIVRLGLFADVLQRDELKRIDGVHVSGLWFERDDPDQNARHAAEMVADRLETVSEDLAGHGVAATTDDLARLPVRVEVGDDVERALTAAAESARRP
jgi:hypothetical protein